MPLWNHQTEPKRETGPLTCFKIGKSRSLYFLCVPPKDSAPKNELQRTRHVSLSLVAASGTAAAAAAAATAAAAAVVTAPAGCLATARR